MGADVTRAERSNWHIHDDCGTLEASLSLLVKVKERVPMRYSLGVVAGQWLDGFGGVIQHGIERELDVSGSQYSDTEHGAGPENIMPRWLPERWSFRPGLGPPATPCPRV